MKGSNTFLPPPKSDDFPALHRDTADHRLYICVCVCMCISFSLTPAARPLHLSLCWCVCINSRIIMPCAEVAAHNNNGAARLQQQFTVKDHKLWQRQQQQRQTMMGRWLCYSSLLLVLLLLLRCTSFRVRDWLSSASFECPCRACVSQQRSQVRLVCLAGWLESLHGNGQWLLVDIGIDQAGARARDREREFKANNAVNFKRRIPSINVNTRFINLHTKHTHARKDRGRERERQRGSECVTETD